MYVFGPASRNPFITSSSQPDGADISRHAIEFKHIDAWRYGHNLVEIIIKKSSDVEPVWHFPFRIGPARLAFDGFADYNSPKGKDAAGRDTCAEFITRPQLKLEISRVVGRQARVLEVGVGFHYWHNMFGKDADKVPGAKEFTPVFTLAVHLPRP